MALGLSGNRAGSIRKRTIDGKGQGKRGRDYGDSFLPPVETKIIN